MPVWGSHKRKNRRKRKHTAVRPKEIELICFQCKQKFKKIRGEVIWFGQTGHKRPFCSKKCLSTYKTRGSGSGLRLELEALRSSKKMKTWRKKVFKRDNFTCQECGKANVPLNAHHIKRFYHFPELRFRVSNGITLCEICHRKTFKKEEQFEDKYTATAEENRKRRN